MDRLITIIRHAEKPAADSPCLGVNDLGEPDDKALTVRGWQRSGGLAHLFSGPISCDPQGDRCFCARQAGWERSSQPAANPDDRAARDAPRSRR